jgi:hypothetical protein
MGSASKSMTAWVLEEVVAMWKSTREWIAEDPEPVSKNESASLKRIVLSVLAVVHPNSLTSPQPLKWRTAPSLHIAANLLSKRILILHLDVPPGPNTSEGSPLSILLIESHSHDMAIKSETIGGPQPMYQFHFPSVNDVAPHLVADTGKMISKRLGTGM